MPTVHMIHQGGCAVAVIKYTDAELDLLARLMRSENGITSGTLADSSRNVSLARLLKTARIYKL